MQFTESDIKQAMAEEGNTGDFPQLLKKLREAQVVKYFYHVENGLYIFTNKDNEELFIKEDRAPISISLNVDNKKIREMIEASKAGEFTFDEFCKSIAEAGISSWLVDVRHEEIAYFDQMGQTIEIDQLK